MALNEMLSVTSTLSSPDPEFTLRSQGKNFPTQAFNSEEANLLETQLNEIMMAFDNAAFTELLLQRADSVALAATFAKQVFDEKLFGGINASDNEIAFDVLRPGHIYQDDTGTIQNDWYFQPGTTGWVDWIGDGANNYTFGEDQVTVVLGFMDQDTSTEISAVNVDEFGRNVNMIPQDLNDMRLRDNETEQQVKPLPTLIGQENDDVHIRLRADRDVESQPRLLGFTFGLGSYLNAEDY